MSVLLGLVLLSSAAVAGDAAAGKTKSATCAACHGPEGVSVNPMWPNLAGQQEMYLAKQMRDFREGNRIRLQPANSTMEPIYLDSNNSTDIQGKVVGVLRLYG